MKIEDNRMDREITFSNLDVGDCFIYNDGHYIKIDESYTTANAFDLECNVKEKFDIDTLVTFVDAKVVIGGEK